MNERFFIKEEYGSREVSLSEFVTKTINSYEKRLSALEGKHIPDKAYDINLLRKEVERLEDIIKTAYKELEVDGPNTDRVNAILLQYYYGRKP